MEDTFARVLLRIYDKKMMNGQITFSRSGITKEDFTNLCMNPGYVVPKERFEIICEKMALSEEEREKLLALAGDAFGQQ